MMTELFLPEADAEFREAVRYYESEAPGLGLAFAAEVRKAVSEIIANPKAATPLESGIRRRLVRRFPYDLLYSIEGDVLVIIRNVPVLYPLSSREWSGQRDRNPSHREIRKTE